MASGIYLFRVLHLLSRIKSKTKGLWTRKKHGRIILILEAGFHTGFFGGGGGGGGEGRTRVSMTLQNVVVVIVATVVNIIV